MRTQKRSDPPSVRARGKVLTSRCQTVARASRQFMPAGRGGLCHALVEGRLHDVKPACIFLGPAERKGCEPSSVLTPYGPRGAKTLEHPYLDRLPEKKEAHFSEIVDFSVGRGDAISYARDFLDRGRGCGASKMYLDYCTEAAIGKGKICELRKLEHLSSGLRVSGRPA